MLLLHCVLNYSCSHCLLSLCDHLNSLALATISFLVEIVEFKAFHNAHTIRTHRQAAAAATIATPSTESVCVYCAGTLQCDDDDVQGHSYSAREKECVYLFFSLLSFNDIHVSIFAFDNFSGQTYWCSHIHNLFTTPPPPPPLNHLNATYALVCIRVRLSNIYKHNLHANANANAIANLFIFSLIVSAI